MTDIRVQFFIILKYKILYLSLIIFPFYSKVLEPSFVEGVYIYSRPLDGPFSPESYSWVTVLQSDGESEFHLTGLVKYTRYEFFLVPFFRTIDGRPSNTKIVRTKEDGKIYQITNTYISFDLIILEIFNNFSVFFSSDWISPTAWSYTCEYNGRYTSMETSASKFNSRRASKLPGNYYNRLTDYFQLIVKVRL